MASTELVIGNPLRPLTNVEKELINQVIKPDVTVEIVVPETISASELWATLGVTCRALRKSLAQADILMPVLGGLLLRAQQNPELYENRAVSFEELVSKIGEEFGVGRSTCYESKRLAERWGGEPLRDFPAIGRVKFSIINKAVAKGDEDKPYVHRLLDKAKELSADALEAYCEKQGLIEAGEASGTTIHIKANKSVAKRWRDWCDSPEIQAYVGNNEPFRILDDMIKECQNEWESEGSKRVREAEKDAERAAKEAERLAREAEKAERAAKKADSKVAAAEAASE